MGGSEMNPFDIQMIAITALLLMLSMFMHFIDKRFNYGMAGIFVVLALIWGDDLCSRHDRLAFYTTYFDKGGEIVCKDDNANPLLISEANGWKRTGAYLFRNTQGLDLISDSCEIISKTEPHCIPMHWLILSGIAASLWLMRWMSMVVREIENSSKERKNAREERKEKIRKGAEEMAELYKSDPELKELNAFVGDYKELPDDTDTQEKNNV
jgi:hypothetical protein